MICGYAAAQRLWQTSLYRNIHLKSAFLNMLPPKLQIVHLKAQSCFCV